MEEKILEFCKEYFKKYGYAPSSREIGDGVGLGSTSSVNLHMNRLFDSGLIERRTKKENKKKKTEIKEVGI